jgi:hypothetical protein
VLSVVGDGPELMVACGQLGLDGLVTKRLDSIYGWANAASTG